ncbi:MAG: histidinol-phosphate transaminase [Verrucomicrobiota bacterium]|nr:histidinol-phosphate transaminase [Verrucomicrobiales bacterium]MBN77121.1 histidinol-phosphate transaminase [Verrucomicrobiaceae bacterium]MEE2724248.1 histidinol-phosphate transaminase [Verrucomicrobiota bacterium]|tara:strand:+ start:1610 stop:2707 length:1098 start_codon:yes stop_codon:yes gene_type:complete
MIDPCEFANPQLRDLIPYEPGKPIEDVARELGLDPDNVIKLASNENPLGPSPKAIEAMKSLASDVHVYPDGGGWKLRNAIAEKFSLSMDNIVLGNGSNEIIEFVGHSFLKPGDQVIVAEHAFVVYKLMATLFGADTVEVKDPNFVHDLEAMAAAVTSKTRQIFIANPNNPTGTLVKQEEIDRFMDAVPEDVIVIFDEAYYEFLDSPPDTLKYIREGRNVIVMRTFSKIQGLAGLRIGYGITTPGLASILQKTRQPFNANLLAQEAALAALADEEHQEKTKEITDEGRELLQNEFEKMGIEFVTSYANFVLIKVGDGDAVFEKMLQKGVIVRAMRGYKLPEWIRVSIGTKDENMKFLELLRSIITQ